MKSAVSIAPAVAAKRHISLCGCVHNLILVVTLFDRQYNMSSDMIPHIGRHGSVGGICDKDQQKHNT